MATKVGIKLLYLTPCSPFQHTSNLPPCRVSSPVFLLPSSLCHSVTSPVVTYSAPSDHTLISYHPCPIGLISCMKPSNSIAICDDIVITSNLDLIQVYEAATPDTVDGLSVPVELVLRLLTISTAHDKSLSTFL